MVLGPMCTTQNNDAKRHLSWTIGAWEHFNHILGLCLGIILNCLKLEVPFPSPLAMRAADLVNAFSLSWPSKIMTEGLGNIHHQSIPEPKAILLDLISKTKTMLIQRGLLSVIRGF